MDLDKKNHFKDLLKIQKELNESAIESMIGEDVTQNVRSSFGELSSFDNHPADVGTEVFMAEHALGLKAMHEGSLKDVDEAFNRIDKDQYGICTECSKTIDEERLEILPETKLCIDCARDRDVEIQDSLEAIRHRPPGLNDVLTTSGGIKSVRDPLEGRDGGDDILNDLMKFGSAQSPSEQGNFKDFNEFYNTQMSEDGIVEDVDKISNEQYTAQLPD